MRPRLEPGDHGYNAWAVARRAFKTDLFLILRRAPEGGGIKPEEF